MKALARMQLAGYADKAMKSFQCTTKHAGCVQTHTCAQPVGNGLTAFKYLAPYIFRVAISHRRIVKVEDDQVTFRYRASGTGETKFCAWPTEKFIHRSLRVQHVLPRSCVKVRYSGLFSPGHRQQLTALRQQLGAAPAGHLHLRRTPTPQKRL